jgi:DNA-binding response OmpR family regulator
MSKGVSDATNQDPVIIFVVEDEVLLRDLIGPALEEAGFSVVTASNGEEAIGLLEREDVPPIRALLTDIDLGTEISGWDVARRARELRPGIPVVYVTGRGAEEWSAQGVPNSVLITKPFAPIQVVTAISQLLNEVPCPGEPSPSQPQSP